VENRSLRVLRGWLGALAATGLAAASHAVAGGGLPGPLLLGLVLVLSGAVCTALAGRDLSLPRTAAAVLLSQGAYHLVFGLLAHPGSSAALATDGTLGGHAAHGFPTTVDPASILGSAADAGHAPWMPWSHAAAALLTIAVLRRGGLAVRALLNVIGLGTPVAILRWKQAPAHARVVLPPAAQIPGLPDLGIPLRALRRRGPPSRPAL
jgi:hypothetical protein